MKPSYFLEPDAEKIRSFFRSFSLPKEFMADLEIISISKIWINESENSWELEYSSLKPVETRLMDALSDHIKSAFNLNILHWKLLQEKVSLTQPASEPV